MTTVSDQCDQPQLFRKELFWDVDWERFDWARSRRLVIERVLTRGNWDEFRNLIAFYGPETIKDEVVKIAYLDPRTLSFASFWFRIPKKYFLCYKRKRSRKIHFES